MNNMKALMLAASIVLAASALVGFQAGTVPEAEKEAILKTALDYSDGAYSGDAARMERAIHPDLNKLAFGRRGPAMGLAANYSTFSVLVEATRLGLMNLEPEKRLTETAVLEVKDDVACAKVRTARWCDYLQMIKVNGQWKIINVLWTMGLSAPPQAKAVPNFDGEKERTAAQAAARDFIEGLLSGDAGRLEKALHPETNMVTFMVASKTNAGFINRARYSGLLEPTKAKLNVAPENSGQAEVRVLDLMDGMAFAAAATGMGTMYLQLQLLDGQWKAVNILVRPTNNLFPPPPPAKKQS